MVELEQIKDLPFREIQIICKDLGLNAKGNKEQLLQKIEAYMLNNRNLDEAENDYQTEPELISSPEEVYEAADELNLNEQVFATSPTTKDGHRVDDVVDELNALFAGRAQAKYNPNNPQMIEFHGGPRQRWDLTIHQPKSVILGHARTFCGRAFVMPGDIGTLDGVSKRTIAGIDLNTMTPQQKQELKENLQSILAE